MKERFLLIGKFFFNFYRSFREGKSLFGVGVDYVSLSMVVLSSGSILFSFNKFCGFLFYFF